MDDDLEFKATVSAEIANLLVERCLAAGEGPATAIEVAVSVAAMIAMKNNITEIFNEELRIVRRRVKIATEGTQH